MLTVVGEVGRIALPGISVVLRREADEWLVVHEHMSAPVGFESTQAVAFVTTLTAP